MTGTSSLRQGDALVVADVQNDFLPGGALGIQRGDEVIRPLNELLGLYSRKRLPVFLTRDWHPAKHCSFTAEGGPWPEHCVAGTPGAEFSPDVVQPAAAVIVSKATSRDQEAYSAFQGTPLAELLRRASVRRLTVGGLATDYCVRATVLDALREGYEVRFVLDGIRAVDVQPGDGDRAVAEMVAAGATATTSREILAAEESRA